MTDRKHTVVTLADGEPRSVGTLGMVWLEDLRVHGYADMTQWNRRSALERFSQWCTDRGVVRVEDVTRSILERYQRWLFYFRQKHNEKPLTLRSQAHQLNTLKQFFRWLTRSNFLPSNPACDLDLPRSETRLPRTILTSVEVEKVLVRPVISTLLGLRDRAIMETLYSTGMRRSELARLAIYDVDVPRGTVFIRQGKNRKDRVVPVGERALKWIAKYLDEARPQLLVPPDQGALFLAHNGKPVAANYLSGMVREYIEDADLGKGGSCHVFRHTAATLMLENGADIRFIQALLGHAELSTTQIYTQVSITKLKEIHAATHPASRDALLAQLDADALEEEEEDQAG
jgi:integrase/recombinase XerD